MVQGPAGGVTCHTAAGTNTGSSDKSEVPTCQVPSSGRARRQPWGGRAPRASAGGASLSPRASTAASAGLLPGVTLPPRHAHVTCRGRTSEGDARRHRERPPHCPPAPGPPPLSVYHFGVAPWILEKLPLPPEPESFRRAAGERACPWAARAVGPSSLGRRGLYLAQRAVLPASDCPSPPTPCSPSGAPATYPVLCLHPKDFPSSLVIRQALNLGSIAVPVGVRPVHCRVVGRSRFHCRESSGAPVDLLRCSLLENQPCGSVLLKPSRGEALGVPTARRPPSPGLPSALLGSGALVSKGPWAWKAQRPPRSAGGRAQRGPRALEGMWKVQEA